MKTFTLHTLTSADEYKHGLAIIMNTEQTTMSKEEVVACFYDTIPAYANVSQEIWPAKLHNGRAVIAQSV
jgi:hypothetical protein